VLVGTKVDIVLVKTEMNVVLVRTKTVLVLIGTEIGMLRVGTKIAIVLVRTRIDVWFVGIGKENSCIDLERVVKILKYLFKLRIKLIDWEAPLRESGEVYIDLDIWLKSNISGSAVKRSSPLKGCVIVISIFKELTDLKVRSVVVPIREI